MSYKNILTKQISEFNDYYRTICKLKPGMSIKDKQAVCFSTMREVRQLSTSDLMNVAFDPTNYCLKLQYSQEVVLTKYEVEHGIPRYYLKDDSLFDFFKQTEIKAKDVQSIFDSNVFENCSAFGVIGQTDSFLIYMLIDISGRHFVSVFTDDMNYTFCVEEFDRKESNNPWVFNMAMNFLFYINAFPESVIDGVPAGVKRNPAAKSISMSDKIISHTSVEHGFIRPHFRSGYFRHLNSDYFVNCKGQVRFIESTMVKGRAKTVLNKEN